MSFSVGEKVVYPNHGVGIIVEISTQEIDGCSSRFYHLRLSSTNSVVMIPISNALQVGLRPPIDREDCERLLQRLSENFSSPPSDWKDRFKDFSDKMRTGDVFCVADILKTLTYLSQLKPLSFREKRMLERARFLVVSELVTSSSYSEEEINQRVDQALQEACHKHRQQLAAKKIARAASAS
ncbi:MAG: CarD family transcriptional regulator [Acidobacteriota bacterium]|nr:CarD family transcriptional regulator [Blastocatellia bacterium]MDW8411371.1 CarD family transcriptional regulator [Acidobacteriota bacterium]